MKIKTFILKKHMYDFESFCLSNGAEFCCIDQLMRFFPHITDKKTELTLTVFSHAVKGSKRFTISQGWVSMGGERYFNYFIKEIYGCLWNEMKMVIKSILYQFRDTIKGPGLSMFVWVTVK